MKSEERSGGAGGQRGSGRLNATLEPEDGAQPRQQEDGPSEKARRNVKQILIELLGSKDPDVLPLLTAVAKPTPVIVLKDALLELLNTDLEVRRALQDIGGKTILLGESDAETAQHLVQLIDERLRQTLRPDSFRRPSLRT